MIACTAMVVTHVICRAHARIRAVATVSVCRAVIVCVMLGMKARCVRRRRVGMVW